ncbi:MAG: hypothetical protein MUO64_17805 [Anaerolineales bacterium]|nr:hypothetical protein [Anaerolineales bacterium]
MKQGSIHSLALGGQRPAAAAEPIPFNFTTYDRVNVETVLYAPIWRRADRHDAGPLFFMD